MVKRYPHSATIRWVTEPSKNDVSGVHSEGQPTDKSVDCRFEPAGKSVYKSSGGDTELVFGYKVFLPVLDFTIPSTAVIIKAGVEMAIARVDVNQKNTVLWL